MQNIILLLAKFLIKIFLPKYHLKLRPRRKNSITFNTEGKEILQCL